MNAPIKCFYTNDQRQCKTKFCKCKSKQINTETYFWNRVNWHSLICMECVILLTSSQFIFVCHSYEWGQSNLHREAFNLIANEKWHFHVIRKPNYYSLLMFIVYKKHHMQWNIKFSFHYMLFIKLYSSSRSIVSDWYGYLKIWLI